MLHTGISISVPCYSRCMTFTKHIAFYSNGFNLAATIVLPEDDRSIAGVIRIGGGANLSHRPNRWQEWLGSNNITSMAFDFTGVGNSEGKLGETNLSTRLEDARAALETFQKSIGMNTDHIYIMGVSMGAPIAIQLGVEYQCKGLILASPAAYSRGVWGKNFGEPFSKAVRAKEGWKDSEEFETLRSFPGEILFAYSGHDDVIPAPILETYDEIIVSKEGTRLVLDASHAFLREQSNETDAKKKFWSSVHGLIKN